MLTLHVGTVQSWLLENSVNFISLERFEGFHWGLVLTLAFVDILPEGGGSLHVEVGFRRALSDLLLLLLLRNLLQERQMF